MTYKILSTTQLDETITTKVEYNLNGTIVVCDVAHYMPNGIEDIELGISNRAISEQRKLDAIANNQSLLGQIVIGQENQL